MFYDKTVSAYVQETGRAGRQGDFSVAILHFNNTDLASSKEDMHKDIKELCQTKTCRRQVIALHFGWDIDPEMYTLQHNCCDVCEEHCVCDICKESAQHSIILDADKVKDNMCSHLRTDLVGYMRKENNSGMYGLSGHLYTQLDTNLLNRVMNVSRDFTMTLEEFRDMFCYLGKLEQEQLFSIIKHHSVCECFRNKDK